MDGVRNASCGSGDVDRNAPGTKPFQALFDSGFKCLWRSAAERAPARGGFSEKWA